MTTDFVRFLEDLHKLFRNSKLAKLLFLNFRTVFVNLTKSVVVFWINWQNHLAYFGIIGDKKFVDLTKNNLYRKKRDITIVETPALDEILKAHMVEGFLDTASINDEQILETVNGYDIRMTVYNTYPQRSVMANCAKVNCG